MTTYVRFYIYERLMGMLFIEPMVSFITFPERVSETFILKWQG